MEKFIDLRKGEFLGPIAAEVFSSDEEIVKAYITTSGDQELLEDKYLKTIVSGNRIVLTGTRGSGKTMIMLAAEKLLKNDIKSKLIDHYDYMLPKETKKYMPIYISFSGFKNDVTLQHKSTLTQSELAIASDIFRGYFYITLLQSILNQIEVLELDRNVDFNLFGLRTKFGIKKEVDNAILQFKRLGFRELIRSKELGFDISVKIPPIDFSVGPKFGNKIDTKEVTLDDMQKTSLFKETLDSICEAYNIDKFVFLFDEVYYLQFLQNEFFNVLFGFRGYSKISYVISAYPAFMEYGDYFDIPDDAKEVNVGSSIYKPNREEYENRFYKLISNRSLEYSNMQWEDIIQQKALSQLILLTNGNPRILLQAIEHIWLKNDCKQISLSNISQDAVSELTTQFYVKFLEDQAKRYKTSYEKASNFLKIITDRLREYNNRNDNATSFFLLNKEIERQFSETIDLLNYSRIIDKIKVSSFGGGSSKKGTLYFLTPMYGWYAGIYTRQQINSLQDGIRYSAEKDNKVQFDSSSSFSFKNLEVDISCPAFINGDCPKYLCESSFSEAWARCPFHEGINLEIKTKTPDEVSIDELAISERIKKRLKDGKIETLKDVLDCGVENLRNIPQIGFGRSREIYRMTKEYVDDNL